MFYIPSFLRLSGRLRTQSRPRDLLLIDKIFPELIRGFVVKKKKIERAFAVICLLLGIEAYAADDFESLAQKCAPQVAVDTLRAIVKTESAFNPFAIGIVPKPELKEVNDELISRRHDTLESSVALAEDLRAHGYTFAVGLAQINTVHLPGLGLSLKQAFDPCTNLKAAASILTSCYQRALKVSKDKPRALKDSFSCYYSGGFSVGYRHGYVDKVLRNAGIAIPEQPSVPSIQETLNPDSVVPHEDKKAKTGETDGLVISKKDRASRDKGLVF